MQLYDAILIPGGGLQTDGTPHPWVQARLDAAIAASDSASLIPLSGGTTHKAPPLHKTGFPVVEAEASALYLKQKGVAPNRIRTECYLLDTVGNAYFSRVLHAQPANFKHILVISSAFHIERCKLLFNWVYGLHSDYNLQCVLAYKSVPNIGISADLLTARQAKEQQAIKSITPIMQSITTMAALYTWLYTTHAAYAVGLQSVVANKAIQQSY